MLGNNLVCFSLLELLLEKKGLRDGEGDACCAKGLLVALCGRLDRVLGLRGRVLRDFREGEPGQGRSREAGGSQGFLLDGGLAPEPELVLMT